jgi:hypothetical protein
MDGFRHWWGPEDPAAEVRPVLLWVSTALLALVMADASALVPVAVALAAVLIVLTTPGNRTSTLQRLLLATAFVPAAFPDQSPTAAWILAAGAVGVAVSWRRHEEPGDTPLLRHLERARRRGEPASLMVVRLPPASRGPLRDLQRRMRAADSTRAVRGLAADEIHAVMDGGDLEARAVELRLGTGEIDRASVGWARFPEDGGSLDVLLATARERARLEPQKFAATTERPASRFTPSMVKAD